MLNWMRSGRRGGEKNQTEGEMTIAKGAVGIGMEGRSCWSKTKQGRDCKWEEMSQVRPTEQIKKTLGRLVDYRINQVLEKEPCLCLWLLHCRFLASLIVRAYHISISSSLSSLFPPAAAAPSSLFHYHSTYHFENLAFPVKPIELSIHITQMRTSLRHSHTFLF